MRFIKRALIFLCDFIYPPCCLICGKNTKEILCKSCNKEIINQEVFKVNNKIQRDFYFNKHIYIFLYQNTIRKLIIDYKFNDKSYLSKLFSKIIIKNEKICRILKSYDIIIPVPIHKKREKERGYNQSKLVAKELANNIDCLTFENDVIIKKINNNRQSDLTRKDREKNVQGVYEILNNEKIKDRKIILFDDIYTTGSTAKEISRLLIRNGAKEVLLLTIAKD